MKPAGVTQQRKVRQELEVRKASEKPKVIYLENTLTPEQNAALYDRGLRAWLEIIEGAEGTAS